MSSDRDKSFVEGAILGTLVGVLVMAASALFLYALQQDKNESEINRISFEAKTAISNMQLDAIEAGVAEYYLDEGHQRQFRWKTQSLTSNNK